MPGASRVVRWVTIVLLIIFNIKQRPSCNKQLCMGHLLAPVEPALEEISYKREQFWAQPQHNHGCPPTNPPVHWWSVKPNCLSTSALQLNATSQQKGILYHSPTCSRENNINIQYRLLLWTHPSSNVYSSWCTKFSKSMHHFCCERLRVDNKLKQAGFIHCHIMPVQSSIASKLPSIGFDDYQV